MLLVDFDDDSIFDVCFPPQCVEISFSLNILVFDVLSFTTYSSNETSINDTIAPNVTALFPSNGTIFEVNETIEIGANITDTSGISLAAINISLPNGTITEINLTGFGEFFNTSFTIPDLTGDYTVLFFANDTENNINSSESLFFTVVEIPIEIDFEPLAVAILVFTSIFLIFNVFKEIKREFFPHLKIIGFAFSTVLVLAALNLAIAFQGQDTIKIIDAIDTIFIGYAFWTILLSSFTLILLGSWIVSRLSSPLKELKFRK